MSLECQLRNALKQYHQQATEIICREYEQDSSCIANEFRINLENQQLFTLLFKHRPLEFILFDTFLLCYVCLCVPSIHGEYKLAVYAT